MTDFAGKNKFNPDWVPAPGETISEVIGGLGLSQVDLARRLGVTTKFVSQLISGKAALTENTALMLERVVGVRAGFWLNLEKDYQLYLARKREVEKLTALKGWVDKFPLNSMVKEGYFPKPTAVADAAQALLSFFGVADPDAWETQWGAEAKQIAFRSSKSFTSNPYSIAAWLRRGQIIAQHMPLPAHDRSTFKILLPKLRELTVDGDATRFIPTMQEICAQCGVALIFVPELQGTILSGAAHWFIGKPIIQLSLRHKTDDHLWFSFFHETKHVLDHSSKTIYINENTNSSKEEEEANAFSRDFLIPPGKYKILRRTMRVTLHDIVLFAESINIAPGIVVGRLQHDGLLPRSVGNKLKKRYTWVQ